MSKTTWSRRRPLVIVALRRRRTDVGVAERGRTSGRGPGEAWSLRQPSGARRRESAARAGPSAFDGICGCVASLPAIDARRRAARGAPAADTLAREPARNPGASVPHPSARRASGALFPMRDASRRARPRIVQICRQSKDLQSDAPKRASPARRRRGERLDIASTTTSRSLRRGGPPRAAKAHNIQAALQTA